MNPGRQALLVLAHLRCGDTYSRLAAGSGIGLATVCRYIHETVRLPAALAPDPNEATQVVARKAYVILDGTLLRIDRIAADRPFYSGKHKRHGMNIQVLADPAGRLLWTSCSPARAGMVPPASRRAPRPACAPRASEDGPIAEQRWFWGAVVLPARAGWSHQLLHCQVQAVVFPCERGMVPAPRTAAGITAHRDPLPPGADNPTRTPE